MKVFLIYLANWWALLVIAILNGALRDKGYGTLMSETAAHQLSTFIGLFLFTLYMGFLTRARPIGSARLAFSIGGLWLVMTAAFEFLFGHFVAGHSWDHLLHDYNLCAGRLWPLVLLWTAVAPYILYRVRSS